MVTDFSVLVTRHRLPVLCRLRPLRCCIHDLYLAQRKFLGISIPVEGNDYSREALTFRHLQHLVNRGGEERRIRLFVLVDCLHLCAWRDAPAVGFAHATFVARGPPLLVLVQN